MFDKAKQMWQLKRMQDRLAAEKIEYEENGISVVVRGDQKIEKLVIDGQEDSRITQVINKALEKAKIEIASKAQDILGDFSGFLK